MSGLVAAGRLLARCLGILSSRSDTGAEGHRLIGTVLDNDLIRAASDFFRRSAPLCRKSLILKISVNAAAVSTRLLSLTSRAYMRTCYVRRSTAVGRASGPGTFTMSTGGLYSVTVKLIGTTAGICSGVATMKIAKRVRNVIYLSRGKYIISPLCA